MINDRIRKLEKEIEEEFFGIIDEPNEDDSDAI
jgi:hypothetical protein